MMDEELVEKVAERLWQADCQRTRGRERRRNWSDALGPVQDRFRFDARAAIQAMMDWQSEKDKARMLRAVECVKVNQYRET